MVRGSAAPRVSGSLPTQTAGRVRRAVAAVGTPFTLARSALAAPSSGRIPFVSRVMWPLITRRGTAINGSAQSWRRRPLLRRLFERVGQRKQLRFAAGRAGETDTEWLRLWVE